MLTAPPSVIPPDAPEPPVIDTPNASDIVAPIEPVNPAIELIDTDLSAALASANDAVCVPVRLIAAFTDTLPLVDSSFDSPVPKFTTSTTVNAPPLVTFSAPVVVTGPTLVASVLIRLTLPVLPVTEVNALPALVRVYAPFVPFSVSSPAVNFAVAAASCVTAPVELNASVFAPALTAALSIIPPPPAVSVVAPPVVTAPATVRLDVAPVVLTVSAPDVVTVPPVDVPSCVVAPAFTRLIVPVLPVSVLMLLAALSSVYVAPLPSRLTVVALSAPGCVTVPKVVNVNAPVVAILPKLVVAAMFFRSMVAALPVPPVVSELKLLSSVPSVNVPPPFTVSAPAVNAAV